MTSRLETGISKSFFLRCVHADPTSTCHLQISNCLAFLVKHSFHSHLYIVNLATLFHVLRCKLCNKKRRLNLEFGLYIESQAAKNLRIAVIFLLLQNKNFENPVKKNKAVYALIKAYPFIPHSCYSSGWK